MAKLIESRVSEELYEQVRADAESVGLDIAPYIRMLVKNSRIAQIDVVPKIVTKDSQEK